MTVTFRPRGGLGNQLFVWATAWDLADRCELPLVADLGSYDSRSKRDYLLGEFDSGIVRTDGRPPWSHRIRRVLPPQSVATRHQPWRSWGRFNSPGRRVKKLYLDGYFQDPVSFVARRTELADRVSRLHRPSRWFLDTLEELERGGPFLGVHVRRGDYLILPRHGALPNTYYQAALIKAAEFTSDVTRSVVFSDSPDSLHPKNFTTPGHDGLVISPPPNSSPLESLMLMAMSRVLILANSTFSWWAAFVGNPEAVFFPDPWFRDSRLVTPGWLPENSAAVDSGFGDTDYSETSSSR